MERKEQTVRRSYQSGWRYVLVLLLVLAASVSAEYVQDPSNPEARYHTDPASLPGADHAPGMATPADAAQDYFLCRELGLGVGGNGVTDVWGWKAPDGRYYALVGSKDGLTVVNVTDEEIVQTIDYTPNCGWRDIKTYGHYAYVVSECHGFREGLMTVDLQYLPDSVSFVRSVPVDGGTEVTSHNLSIDTVKGFIYIEGKGLKDSSVYVWSVNPPGSPERPFFVTSFGQAGVHDIYAHNDTIYTAAGFTGLWEVYDATDKSNIHRVLAVSIPNTGYVHNIWINADRTVAVTTEETSSKTIKVWDISDFNNVQLASQFLGPSGLAHNAHIEGDLVYVSHYESGVIVADISDPYNTQVLAQFDTWSTENATFEGCWGVFPHTDNGTVYLSNRNGFLYVLNQLTGQRSDSIWATDASADETGGVVVEIHGHNSLPVGDIVVPIHWTGPAELVLDSATVGDRTAGFNDPNLIASWQGGRQRVFRLTTNGGNLPAGSGLIMKAWFTAIPSGADQTSALTFKPLNQYQAAFTGSCGALNPDTVSATITVTSCCDGVRGDFDADGSATLDAIDLAVLVDYLFANGDLTACPSEADVNNDGNVANGVDLSYAVDYLFAGGADPATCD